MRFATRHEFSFCRSSLSHSMRNSKMRYSGLQQGDQLDWMQTNLATSVCVACIIQIPIWFQSKVRPLSDRCLCGHISLIQNYIVAVLNLFWLSHVWLTTLTYILEDCHNNISWQRLEFICHFQDLSTVELVANLRIIILQSLIAPILCCNQQWNVNSTITHDQVIMNYV